MSDEDHQDPSQGAEVATLPGTPCPFLRCAINPDNEADTGVTPLRVGRTSVTQLYAHARAHSNSRLFGVVVAGIGLVGNGLGPRGLWRNLVTLSFDSAALTGSLLDKPRADTGILQARGSGIFCADYFDRMIERWGAEFVPEDGGAAERGLDLAAIRSMIGTRRSEDNGNPLTTLAAYGEFIPSLWLFGKRSAEGTRYLAEADLLLMFRDMRFPASAASR